MMEFSIIMKYKTYNYKIVEPKIYSKTCTKCNHKFKTTSRNKRLCENCKKVLNDELNNIRVQNHYKRYKNKNKIGTGCLEEHPLPPLKEIDAILYEMKHLHLI